MRAVEASSYDTEPGDLLYPKARKCGCTGAVRLTDGCHIGGRTTDPSMMIQRRPMIASRSTVTDRSREPEPMVT